MSPRSMLVLVNDRRQPAAFIKNLVVAMLLVATVALPSSFAVAESPNDAKHRPLAVDRGARPPSAASPRILPKESLRYALIVGVDAYADGQIAPPSGASGDAGALARSLVRNAGFPESQVMLLASDQPSERLPTRDNILRRLSNLCGLVGPDGLLLFAFSGHGVQSHKGDAFLLPADAP